MRRLLVLGDERYRGKVAECLSETSDMEVVDCDPALGDCVMYTRLEGLRYSCFVFLGYDHAVTRGALAIVAERSVLLPLWERDDGRPDPSQDGYLFRLPRGLGFRDEEEKTALLEWVPKAATVPSEIVGREGLDASSLARLIAHISDGRWEWADLVERVAVELAGS